MSTETIERPKTQGPTTGEPKVAHIIRKGDEMRGYVNGEEIEAICGERFIPTRDPKKYPVCEACRSALSQEK